jgi:hypothetical protein
VKGKTCIRQAHRQHGCAVNPAFVQFRVQDLYVLKRTFHLSGDIRNLANEGNQTPGEHKVEHQKREQLTCVPVPQLNGDYNTKKYQDRTLIGQDLRELGEKPYTYSTCGYAFNLPADPLLKERLASVGANFFSGGEHVSQVSLQHPQSGLTTGCGRLNLSTDEKPVHSIECGNCGTEDAGHCEVLIHKRGSHDSNDYHIGCHFNATTIEVSSFARCVKRMSGEFTPIALDESVPLNPAITFGQTKKKGGMQILYLTKGEV